MKIRKAVFPVPGLAPRFLPATKAMPKEMLTVVDRPLIQHVVDEAREAGIEHFIFVTGRNKGVIEDHFDRQFELEHTLTERQRRADLEALAQDLPGPGTASFTRQQQPLGLGHAPARSRRLCSRASTCTGGSASASTSVTMAASCSRSRRWWRSRCARRPRRT